MRDPILAEALSRKGAVKRIAALCGVTPGAVCQWNRVPKRHVETLAGYLGKKPSDLRPDIFGPEPQQCARKPSVPWWELPDAQAGHRGAA